MKKHIYDNNEIPQHSHYPHSYGGHYPSDDLDQSFHGPYRGNPLDGGVCGSLRRIFILMVESGVSQCKPLPKSLKGKLKMLSIVSIICFEPPLCSEIDPIRYFCLRSGSDIIGQCLNEDDGLECMNNATKVCKLTIHQSKISFFYV